LSILLGEAHLTGVELILRYRPTAGFFRIELVFDFDHLLGDPKSVLQEIQAIEQTLIVSHPHLLQPWQCLKLQVAPMLTETRDVQEVTPSKLDNLPDVGSTCKAIGWSGGVGFIWRENAWWSGGGTGVRGGGR
jgi:hypothetical protein